MKLKHQIKSIAVILLLATAHLANAAQPAPATQKTVGQKVFATPEEAAKALTEALRKHDKNLLLAVIGQSSGNWLSSGDEVADRHDKEKFIAAYDRKIIGGIYTWRYSPYLINDQPVPVCTAVTFIYSQR